MKTNFGKKEALVQEVEDAVLEVHTQLGSELLESAHEACPTYELELRGLSVQRQVVMPISYSDTVM
ncbi:MAG: hypothetical protein BWY76_01947 [bacterium ADurb.Bin429]|nr:MAG: hypothetical protein BWY76_01947 [bacterium ADurb.Bin429]